MRTLMPTLPSLQNEINRIFESFFSRIGEGVDETLSDWAPRVDVVEDNETVRIYADLPGLNRDDINVSVEQLSLTITGERKRPENADKLTWHRGERLYGTFKRTFVLPAHVDQNKVTAEYKNGVLGITLHKVESAKPRMIAIKAE